MWLDVDVTGGTLRVPALRITSSCTLQSVRHGRFAPAYRGTKHDRTMTQRLSCNPKRKEHAPRALVLHVTPMDENRVSACDGTATIALVCRIILPSGAPHLDFQTDIHI